MRAAAYAKWFAAVWGMLVVLVLLYAWRQTIGLTTVYSRFLPPSALLGVYGHYASDGSAQANITYSKAIGWTVDYPEGTTLVLLPRSNNHECLQLLTDETRNSLASPEPRSSFRLFAPNSRMTMPGNAVIPMHISAPIASAPSPGLGNTFAFNLKPAYNRQTGIPGFPAGKLVCGSGGYVLEYARSYAGRALRFVAETLPNIGLNAARIEISASVDDAENMQVAGGVQQSVSTTLLQPGQFATITYDDALALGRRDEGFVVVGALIALGAAMAIEAVRPLVEWLVAIALARRKH